MRQFSRRRRSQPPTDTSAAGRGGKRKIEIVVPAWTNSKARFFDRDTFLALIDHYESVGWGLYGVNVFSADGQLLTVAIAPEHGAAWARSLADADGVLFSPAHQQMPVTQGAAAIADLPRHHVALRQEIAAKAVGDL
ncbi:MAG: hypothetical protein QOH85_1492, partial [Acidobacteriaceae bacterium]|nr:hypothetical protein [Acidobacteriaceae bacterium]